MNTFKDMHLHPLLLEALASEGYDTPTPIQSQAIPHALEGRDILGIAQTGTGKTAAFTLPLLDHIARNEKPLQRQRTRTLILAPTRELANQIAMSVRTYGRFMRLSVTTVFGGVPVNRQKRALERGVDVLVATPGRLIDLMEQRAVSLDAVENLVLDEADQMLDLGFIHALRKIVPLLPKQRRTMFFSATMPKAISELASQYLTDPVQVAVAPESTTAERVEQSLIHVNQNEKPGLLAHLLTTSINDRVLVFTRTKHGADRVVKLLGRAGIRSEAIHGNKRQNHREKALGDFRSGSCRVLVATDIAARGIDVDGVSHVINYEIPNVPEQYVHRIGRTARAGAAGKAIAFVAGDEKSYIRDIERTIRQKIPVEKLPEDFNTILAGFAENFSVAQPKEEAEERAQAPRGERRGRPERSDRPNREDRPRQRRKDGEREFKPRGDRPSGPRRERAEGDFKPRRERAEGDFKPRRDRAEGDFKPRRERAEGDFKPRRERAEGDFKPRRERAEGDFKPRRDRAEGDFKPRRERAEGDFKPRRERAEGDFKPRRDRAEGDLKPRRERAEGDFKPRRDRAEGDFKPRRDRAEGDFKPRRPRPEGASGEKREFRSEHRESRGERRPENRDRSGGKPHGGPRREGQSKPHQGGQRNSYSGKRQGGGRPRD